MKTLGQIIYGKNADKHSNKGVTFREHMAGTRRDETGAAVYHLGRLGHRIAYDSRTCDIILSKQTYPVAGARAEVGDFRSGLAGRKHTTELTITLASGEMLTWHETISGNLARVTHNQAVKFAAVVNSAAAR